MIALMLLLLLPIRLPSVTFWTYLHQQNKQTNKQTILLRTMQTITSMSDDSYCICSQIKIAPHWIVLLCNKSVRVSYTTFCASHTISSTCETPNETNRKTTKPNRTWKPKANQKDKIFFIKWQFIKLNVFGNLCAREYSFARKHGLRWVAMFFLFLFG